MSSAEKQIVQRNSPIVSPVMKINSADFPLEDRMIVAKPDRIYYEEERDSLAETWDRLLEYYSKKLQEEHRDEMEEAELYRMVCSARAEVETGRTLYELVEKGVLRLHKVRTRSRVRCEFKPFILSSCVGLLQRGICVLREAILHEEKVWMKVRDIRLPVKLVRGEVRIYLDRENYVLVDEGCNYVYPNTWRPKGVTCRVRYLGVSLECSVPPPETMDEIEMVREYFLERSLVQTFSSGDLEVSVSVMGCKDRDDPLCRCIVEELRNGGSVGDMCDRIVLYLSRMLVDRLVGRDPRRKFLNYCGPVLEDGLTSTFFVLADCGVVKVTRSEPGKFEIFVNEIPIRFATLSGP